MGPIFRVMREPHGVPSPTNTQEPLQTSGAGGRGAPEQLQSLAPRGHGGGHAVGNRSQLNQLENRSSGLLVAIMSPGRQGLPRHGQAASVCVSQGDSIAKQLLWNPQFGKAAGVAAVPGGPALGPGRMSSGSQGFTANATPGTGVLGPTSCAAHCPCRDLVLQALFRVTDQAGGV